MGELINRIYERPPRILNTPWKFIRNFYSAIGNNRGNICALPTASSFSSVKVYVVRASSGHGKVL